MADRHNATALPSPSRRSFLNKGVAVGLVASVGSVLVAEAAQADENDKRLVELVQKYSDLQRETVKTRNLHDRLVMRLTEECPPPKEFGLLPPRIRDGQQPPLVVLAWARNAYKAFGSVGTGIYKPRFSAAADEYEARIEAASEAIGLNAAYKRLQELDALTVDALSHIRDTPAQTLAGIVMKLRVLDLDEPFSADPGAEEEDGDFWLHWKGEMLRDAERLAGLPRSPVRKTMEV